MERKKNVWKAIKVLMASMLLVMICGLTTMAAEFVDMAPEGGNIYISSGSYSYSTDIYNRIIVRKPSELAVTGIGIGAGTGLHWSLRIELCNSAMQPMEEVSYVNADKNTAAYFGVKAGTYYIKVSRENVFALAAEVKPVTDKSGKNKKRAATIKRKKVVSGLMLSGEKKTKADWYKFKVTKSKKLQLTLSALSNGTFDFYLYGPSYPRGTKMSLKNKKGVYYSVKAFTKKKIKIKTGTYYIKVVRASYSSGTSGLYTIKWNLK